MAVHNVQAAVQHDIHAVCTVTLLKKCALPLDGDDAHFCFRRSEGRVVQGRKQVTGLDWRAQVHAATPCIQLDRLSGKLGVRMGREVDKAVSKEYSSAECKQDSACRVRKLLSFWHRVRAIPFKDGLKQRW